MQAARIDVIQHLVQPVDQQGLQVTARTRNQDGFDRGDRGPRPETNIGRVIEQFDHFAIIALRRRNRLRHLWHTA